LGFQIKGLENNMEQYIIGIDGGATETNGVLLNDMGDTISKSNQIGTNLSLNPSSVPQIISGLIKELCLLGKISIDDISAIGLGLAGASNEDGRDLLFKELDRENLTKKTIICSDAESAFKIVCPTNYGIMLSVGTGVICYARDIQGKSFRTGGLGHDRDKGSGFWIGEQLLWQLSLNQSAEITDHETIELANILSKTTKEQNIDHGIKNIVNSDDKVSNTASLAKDICKLAEAENDLALGIILEATREIAEYVIQIKDIMDYDEDELILHCNGGLLKNKFFRQQIAKALQFDFKSITWAFSDLSASYGSALIAAELYEIPLLLQDIVLKSKLNV